MHVINPGPQGFDQIAVDFSQNELCMKLEALDKKYEEFEKIWKEFYALRSAAIASVSKYQNKIDIASKKMNEAAAEIQCIKNEFIKSQIKTSEKTALAEEKFVINGKEYPNRNEAIHQIMGRINLYPQLSRL